MNPLPSLTRPVKVGQPVQYCVLMIDPTVPKRPRSRRRSFNGFVSKVYPDKTTIDVSYVVPKPEGGLMLKEAHRVPGVGDYYLGEFWLEY
jgi:hypothetical protein